MAVNRVRGLLQRVIALNNAGTRYFSVTKVTSLVAYYFMSEVGTRSLGRCGKGRTHSYFWENLQ